LRTVKEEAQMGSVAKPRGSRVSGCVGRRSSCFACGDDRRHGVAAESLEVVRRQVTVGGPNAKTSPTKRRVIREPDNERCTLAISRSFFMSSPAAASIRQELAAE
jgi:hypothetical protein